MQWITENVGVNAANVLGIIALLIKTALTKKLKVKLFLKKLMACQFTIENSKKKV